MRSRAVPIGIYLTVAALCFALGARAGDVPPAMAGTPRAAVWKAQRIDFFYVGRTSRYSCDGLRDKVRAMLIDLGARRDPSVIAAGCAGDDLKSSKPAGLRLKIEFASPAFSAAAGRSALTGEAAAVEAAFQPFRITSDAFRNMGVGDCELVQQFSQQILPRFTVRALNQDIVCVPYQPSASRFMVRGEILKALPSDAGR